MALSNVANTARSPLGAFYRSKLGVRSAPDGAVVMVWCNESAGTVLPGTFRYYDDIPPANLWNGDVADHATWITTHEGRFDITLLCHESLANNWGLSWVVANGFAVPSTIAVSSIDFDGGQRYTLQNYKDLFIAAEGRLKARVDRVSLCVDVSASHFSGGRNLADQLDGDSNAIFPQFVTWLEARGLTVNYNTLGVAFPDAESRPYTFVDELWLEDANNAVNAMSINLLA